MPNENSRLCACHFVEECFTLRGGRKCLTSTAVPTIFNYSLAMRNMATQTKVLTLYPHSFVDSFDHTYFKHRMEKGSEVLEKDVSERVAHGSRVVCDGVDHDYTAKVKEFQSEKELVVDVEITVDEELAVIEEVTIKEEFKVEEDVSGCEEITAGEQVEGQTANADASIAIITATTANDHNYIVSASPRTLRRHLLSVEEKLQSCRKKLKVEKEKTKRLLRTVHSLTRVICVLNQKSSNKT